MPLATRNVGFNANTQQIEFVRYQKLHSEADALMSNSVCLIISLKVFVGKKHLSLYLQLSFKEIIIIVGNKHGREVQT